MSLPKRTLSGQNYYMIDTLEDSSEAILSVVRFKRDKTKKEFFSVLTNDFWNMSSPLKRFFYYYVKNHLATNPLIIEFKGVEYITVVENEMRIFLRVL